MARNHRQAAYFLGFLGLLSVLGAGCVSSKPPPRPLELPFSEIYPATFDVVWLAVVKSLTDYMIVEANRESGVLKTDFTESARFNPALYEHPLQEDRMEEVRYRLLIRLSKVILSQTGEPGVRVSITKEMSEYRNFLSDWQRVPTDELEERILLYRIRQRVKIELQKKRQSLGAPAQ